MLRRIASGLIANKRTVILTFEIFWILIFLLDRLTSANSVDIPQFIYVHF
jgi:hypothetical protein